MWIEQQFMFNPFRVVSVCLFFHPSGAIHVKAFQALAADII